MNDAKGKKTVTSSSLADVSVETWTFHHDSCEKTEREKKRKKCGKCWKMKKKKP